ncbi:hypothetical protein G039_0334180 [Pseudomonas aeruginosa VRFPA01]|nr:hypothetical protein G039_0334180 [Pseudomonas aeruginosa VRFPA01]
MEATSALAAQAAGGEHLAQHRMRAVARLLVVLPVDRLHHRQADVETDQVEQLERPHAEPGALAQDFVDRRHGRHVFAEHAQRLGAEGPSGMVDDETGAIAGAHRLVAQGRHQRAQPLGDPGAGGEAVDHLDQAHQRHRVEEMQAGDPSGITAGRGDGGDRQRRGVAGENRLVVEHLFQLAEQRLLGAQVLDNRLDHQLAGAEDPQVLDHPQVVQGARARFLGQPAFFHLPGKRSGDSVARLRRRALAAVEEQHREAGAGGELGDALAHGAGADDADTG